MKSSLVCVDSTYSGSFTICISKDCNVYSFGKSSFKAHGHEKDSVFPCAMIKNLNNIKMISCGFEHCICLDEEGSIYSMGKNDEGQLGIDDRTVSHSHIPQKINNIPPVLQVSCGNYFTICVADNGCLYSFGYNNNGQLGLGNNNKYFSPQQIPEIKNISLIECGLYHAICKSNDNICYSWGYNEYGQLGQGNKTSCSTPIQCNNWPDNIIDIKCGMSHSLLLTGEGRVFTFGKNNVGQLGQGDLENPSNPVEIKNLPEILKIDCGYNYTMCIDINSNLWVFGENSFGQLGYQSKEKYISKPMLHPTLSNIIDISSGGYHTFVKTSSDEIYAFGDNSNLQLGKKTSKEIQITPIQVFEDNKRIWERIIGRSKQKSARK